MPENYATHAWLEGVLEAIYRLYMEEKKIELLLPNRQDDLKKLYELSKEHIPDSCETHVWLESIWESADPAACDLDQTPVVTHYSEQTEYFDCNAWIHENESKRQFEKACKRGEEYAREHPRK